MVRADCDEYVRGIEGSVPGVGERDILKGAEEEHGGRRIAGKESPAAGKAAARLPQSKVKTKKLRARKGLPFAPSFNCAAKFLRLPGSI